MNMQTNKANHITARVWQQLRNLQLFVALVRIVVRVVIYLVLQVQTWHRKLSNRELPDSGVLVSWAAICYLIFRLRAHLFGPALTVLDVQFRYGAADVAELLSTLSRQGHLSIYILTELTVDMVFPFVYVCLLLKLARYLFGYQRLPITVPILWVGLSDVLENLSISLLAILYAVPDGLPAQPLLLMSQPFVWASTGLSCLTAMKFASLFLSLSIFGVRLLQRLARYGQTRRWRRRSRFGVTVIMMARTWFAKGNSR